MYPQVRVRIEPALWQAVIATAKARQIDPSTLVTEALKVYFGPATLIETAAELSAEHMAKVHEIADQLRVISDYIVDRMPSDVEAEYTANANGMKG